MFSWDVKTDPITMKEYFFQNGAGLDPGGGGGECPPPNPENQFENGAKFLCLKGKGRIISLFLHQKCLNVNSSGLANVNCDDIVVMSKVPKLGCGLESECGTEKIFAC